MLGQNIVSTSSHMPCRVPQVMKRKKAERHMAQGRGCQNQGCGLLEAYGDKEARKETVT